jgi:hypothetical protein
MPEIPVEIPMGIGIRDLFLIRIPGNPIWKFIYDNLGGILEFGAVIKVSLFCIVIKAFGRKSSCFIASVVS